MLCRYRINYKIIIIFVIYEDVKLYNINKHKHQAISYHPLAGFWSVPYLIP